MNSSNDIKSAIELIRNPERMNRNTIPLLREAIRKYPFHQTLYLLLLQNMYKVHDPQFGSALKQYALMVADRSVLFEMVEGFNYNIPLQKLEDESADLSPGDRMMTLIDKFLNDIPDTHPHPVGRPFDIHPNGEEAQAKQVPLPQIDYSAYLEMLPDIENSESEDIDATDEKPDEKLEAIQDVKSDIEPDAEARAKIDDEPDFEPDIEDEDELVEDVESGEDSAEYVTSSDYFTETMAGIYIKQQKFEQALKIIETISANNPKKSAYFAEQIRYLKLLVRLNRNKQ